MVNTVNDFSQMEIIYIPDSENTSGKNWAKVRNKISLS